MQPVFNIGALKKVCIIESFCLTYEKRQMPYCFEILIEMYRCAVRWKSKFIRYSRSISIITKWKLQIWTYLNSDQICVVLSITSTFFFLKDSLYYKTMKSVCVHISLLLWWTVEIGHLFSKLLLTHWIEIPPISEAVIGLYGCFSRLCCSNDTWPDEETVAVLGSNLKLAYFAYVDAWLLVCLCSVSE